MLFTHALPGRTCRATDKCPCAIGSAIVLLPPATKLGKIMFSHLSVILFTGVVSFQGGLSVQWGLCPVGSLSGGLCPGWVSVWGSLSRGSLSRGVSVQEGGGLCQEDPPYGNVRAVRILLECILVTSKKIDHGSSSHTIRTKTFVFISTAEIPFCVYKFEKSFDIVLN